MAPQRPGLWGRRLVLWVCVLSSGSAAQTVVWSYPTPREVHGIDVLGGQELLIAAKPSEVRHVRATLPQGGSVLRQWGGLNLPDKARALSTGNILVADTLNARALELDGTGAEVWSFGVNGISACDATHLNQVSDAVRLEGGDSLLADQINHRVLRVSATGSVLWRHGSTTCAAGTGAGLLTSPFSVEPLPGGNVLVTDHGNHRVLELAPTPPVGGNIVWQYGTTGVAGSGPNLLDLPYDAQRLPNGYTVIAERGNFRVQVVAPAGAPVSVSITSPPQTVLPGTCSAAVVLELHEPGGQPAPASAPLSLQLSSDTGGLDFFSDSGCSSALTRLSWPSGDAARSLYFRARSPGSHTLLVSADWMSGDAQVETALAEGDDTGPELEKPRALVVGCECSGVGGGLALPLLAGLLLACSLRPRSSKPRGSASPV